MQFLQNPPPFLFFTGKGGVGKTSVACATAVQLSQQGKRVLLVSTDPASNVAQVFEQKIGHKITAVAAVAGLSALEIDPQAAAQAYRDRIVAPVRGVLPDAVVASIEEQLSGACTTEIAAFDEFTGLLTNATLLHDFSHIIFDTAPTGHTIRMLQLPSAWSEFLANNGAASCLGPLAGLEKQRAQYKAAVDALSDVAWTRMILVARPQTAALKEVARTHAELAALGLTRQHLVINGVLPASAVAQDALAQSIYTREQKALAQIPAVLRNLPTDRISLKSFNLVGLPALRGFFDEQPVSCAASSAAAQWSGLPSLASLIDPLSQNKHGLIMFMGKGGVGKTTLAAATAIALAQRGFEVHLSTSDPAAHLSDMLDGNMPHLSVSRIDPQVETQNYRNHIMATTGKDMDAAGLAVLEEDLRSPCTEEIAVFQAFSRIIREAGKKFVVMDTAPTGHTLLLLDATGAYHNEITRKMKNKDAYFRTPMMQLQDQDYTHIIITTLAETTPVLEAAHLQEDLRRAGIAPYAWVINNSLAAAHTQSPLLQVRAAQEVTQINMVVEQYANRVAVVALQAEEPIGLLRLQKLTEI